MSYFFLETVTESIPMWMTSDSLNWDNYKMYVQTLICLLWLLGVDKMLCGL